MKILGSVEPLSTLIINFFVIQSPVQIHAFG